MDLHNISRFEQPTANLVPRLWASYGHLHPPHLRAQATVEVHLWPGPEVPWPMGTDRTRQAKSRKIKKILRKLIYVYLCRLGPLFDPPKIKYFSPSFNQLNSSSRRG